MVFLMIYSYIRPIAQETLQDYKVAIRWEAEIATLVAVTFDNHRPKNRLTIPEATFRASPLPYNAFEAKLLALLNLSHREKASVFVPVRTSAIARLYVSAISHRQS